VSLGPQYTSCVEAKDFEPAKDWYVALLLAAAAGGADEVAGYCQDVAAGGSAGAHGQGQASPPSVSAPPTTV